VSKLRQDGFERHSDDDDPYEIADHAAVQMVKEKTDRQSSDEGEMLECRKVRCGVLTDQQDTEQTDVLLFSRWRDLSRSGRSQFGVTSDCKTFLRLKLLALDFGI
jgi:hypothetical protein